MTIKTRGFASLNPIDRRKIASMGGRAAHQQGTAHRWTTQEAREQGRRGGLAKGANRRLGAVSGDQTSDAGDIYAQLSKKVA